MGKMTITDNDMLGQTSASAQGETGTPIDSSNSLSGAAKTARIKKVAIIGLPNTSKSQIFNNLTGKYAVVANYPGTTIEMKRSGTRIDGQDYEIIDTPGLHCLYIHSEEEIAVRDMLFTEQPEVIIQCIDAIQYKQSLGLTVELLELGIPMVIALNDVNDAARKGVRVDSTGLERILGVPVVESIPISGLGKDELKKAIRRAQKGVLSVSYGAAVENNITSLVSALPAGLAFKRKIALLLLRQDPFLTEYLEKNYGKEEVMAVLQTLRQIQRKEKDTTSRVISEQYGNWVDTVSNAVARKQKIAVNGFSYRFSQACRHHIFGALIFLGFLAAIYISVVRISGALDTLLTVYGVGPALRFIKSLALPLFWNDLLIGGHGILTLGVFNALCTVLPILSVFFFIFSLLEDSGYIANFCVFSKRFFEKIGVSGKAITPLLLGFGCKSMATLYTRGLATYKEKFITIFLIAFAIPCSAQLAISMAILAKAGMVALFIAFGTLALFNMSAGMILNAVIKEDSPSYFIEVLPAMRFPNIKAVLVKSYYRIAGFLKEAMPIFILAAAALFMLDKTGILKVLEQILTPVTVSWMGLPREIVAVFIVGLARREAAAGLILTMANAGVLNPLQSIVAVVVTTTCFPCLVNILAINKELGVKAAIMVSGLIFSVSLILVGLLHLILVHSLGG